MARQYIIPQTDRKYFPRLFCRKDRSLEINERVCKWNFCWGSFFNVLDSFYRASPYRLPNSPLINNQVGEFPPWYPRLFVQLPSLSAGSEGLLWLRMCGFLQDCLRLVFNEVSIFISTHRASVMWESPSAVCPYPSPHRAQLDRTDPCYQSCFQPLFTLMAARSIRTAKWVPLSSGGRLPVHLMKKELIKCTLKI